ncbi:hypothetical protein DKX38_029835 [Salix brachista]|uniref:PGG domain-containing protein n=1 Tax=Salix brachista TaxID=2182728 RepID=A0A5N5JCD6_9ROSI|nr:hypothetical protein DKX38_029835 [Salix brachista]
MMYLMFIGLERTLDASLELAGMEIWVLIALALFSFNVFIFWICFKEIVESLKDVGSGPFGYGPFLITNGRDETEDREKNERMKKKREETEDTEKNERMKKNREEAFNKARESQLLVAALIATVTFAATFTLPGGYKSDQGTAILAKKAAFIVFLISDAISMVLSFSAVFIHFFLVLYQGSIMESTLTTWKLLGLASLLTMIGMGTLIITFITGTYAVLQPVLGLAVSICLIGLSFFFLVYLVFKLTRML